MVRAPEAATRLHTIDRRAQLLLKYRLRWSLPCDFVIFACGGRMTSPRSSRHCVNFVHRDSKRTKGLWGGKRQRRRSIELDNEFTNIRLNHANEYIPRIASHTHTHTLCTRFVGVLNRPWMCNVLNERRRSDSIALKNISRPRLVGVWG